MRNPVMLFGLLQVVVTLTPNLATAQTSCLGAVSGLSSQYNPATGSGFLALRAGPSSSALQLGQLFNGNIVTLVGKSGDWFQVVTSQGLTGWVSRSYVSQGCGL